MPILLLFIAPGELHLELDTSMQMKPFIEGLGVWWRRGQVSLQEQVMRGEMLQGLTERM